MCKVNEEVIEQSGFRVFPAKENTYFKNGHFLTVFEELKEGVVLNIWYVNSGTGDRQDVFLGTVQTDFEFCLLLKMLGLYGKGQ
jgi:hypothetical protein